MAVSRATQLIALRNLLGSGRHVIRTQNPKAVIHSSLRTSTQPAETQNPVRHFTSGRQLNAPNDSSTIDFAFLPDPDVFPEGGEIYRVPILPENYRMPSDTDERDEVVMKPEISSMSADAVFQPMADLSDGHAMNIDFHAMADRIAVNLKNMKVPAEEQASIMKQLWSDLVDDVLGLNKKTGSGTK